MGIYFGRWSQEVQEEVKQVSSGRRRAIEVDANEQVTIVGSQAQSPETF